MKVTKSQKNIFSNMLDSWGKSTDLYTKALDSNGFALENQEIHLQSIAGKMNVFGAEMTALWQNSIDSNFIKFLIDSGTGVLKLINNLGGLNTVLLVTLGIITMFKFQNIQSGIIGLIGYLRDMGQAFVMVKSGALSLNGALTLLNINPIILGITALTAVIAGVALATKAYNAHQQKLIDNSNEAIESFRNLNNEVKGNISTLQSFSGEFETLSKGVDKNGKNISLSADEYERYNEIVSQLVDINPSIIQGYTDENNAIIDKNTSLKEQIELEKERLGLAKRQTAETFNDSYDARLKDVEKQKKSISNLKFELEDAQSIFNENISSYTMGDLGSSMYLSDVNTDNVQEKIKQLKKEMFEIPEGEQKNSLSNIISFLEAISSNYASTAKRINHEMGTTTKEYSMSMDRMVSDTRLALDTIMQDDIQKLPKEMQDVAKAMMDALDFNKVKDSRDLFALGADISNSINLVEKYGEKFKILSGVQEDNIRVADAYSDIANEEGLTIEQVSLVANAYRKVLSEVSNEQEKVSTSTQTTTKSLEDLQNELKSLESDLSSLDSAIKTINGGQDLTGKQIVDLISKFPQLAKEVSLVNGVYKLSASALEDVKNQAVITQKQQVQSEINKTEVAIKNTKARITAYYAEKNALAQIGNSIENVNSLEDAQSLQNRSTTGNGVPDRIYKQGYESSLMGQASQELVDLYEQKEQFMRELDNIDILSSTQGGDKKSKTPKYLTQGYDDLVAEIEKKRKSVTDEITKTQSAMQLALTMGDIETYEAHKANLINLYDAELLIIKDSAPKLIAERDKLANQLKSTGYFKGIVADLSEVDLEKALRKIDAQIESADESQAQSLNMTKSKIEELGSAVISMNSSINGYSNDLFSSQTESTERYLKSLQDTTDKELDYIDKTIKEIDLKQSVLEENDEQYLILEQQKYDLLNMKQQAYFTQYQAILDKQISAESKQAKEMYNLWQDAEQDRINMLQSMADKAIAIRQSESTAINSFRNKVAEMLQSQHEQEKKAIQDNMKQLKEREDVEKKNIDNRKKQLIQIKEEYDYEKKINALRKSIQDITSDLTGMSRDDSAEGIIRRIELENQLAKEQENLKDTEFDESIKRQEALLDKMTEAITKNYELQYASMQAQLDAEVDYKKQADAMIQNNAEATYLKLLAWNKEYGTSIDADITTIWEGAKTVLEDYDVAQIGVLKTLNAIADKIIEINNSKKGLGIQSFGEKGEQTPMSQPEIIKYINSIGVENLLKGSIPSPLPTGIGSTNVSPVTNNNQTVTIDAPVNLHIAGNTDEKFLLTVKKMLDTQTKNIGDSLKKLGIGRNSLNYGI